MSHPNLTEAGLTYSTVAASAYNAFRNALDSVDRMGRKMPNYELLESDYQECLEDAVAFLEEQAESMTGWAWQDAAERIYERFRTNYCAHDTWQQLPKRDRAAWEALLRHTLNVLGCEPGTGLTDHEDHWQ